LPVDVSEKTKVNINGIEQGMFIKGEHVGAPVLLYLHGGMPDYFLTQRYPTGLEQIFTMVWWEQRGSGMSYRANMPTGYVSSAQLISDAVELTNYLRTRFRQQKIYLMGHSGGTFVGIQVAALVPELYHAYIGVAQMSNQFESERLAHEYMLRRFTEDRNSRMVRRVQEACIGNSPPLPRSYMAIRDVAMHKLGVGTTHGMKSIISGLLLQSLASREYTLNEKIRMWRAKIFSGEHLWKEQLSTDLTRKVRRLEVPIYFLHGMYDYTVSYPLARSYYERIDAPVKGFYTFHRSAHSPLFEEPEKMCEIMRRDVLNGTTVLADRDH